MNKPKGHKQGEVIISGARAYTRPNAQNGGRKKARLAGSQLYM